MSLRNVICVGFLLVGPSASKAEGAELIIKGLDCLNGNALEVRNMDVSVWDATKNQELLSLGKRFQAAPTPKNDVEVGKFGDLMDSLAKKMRSAPKLARVVRVSYGRYRAIVPSNMRVAVAAYLPNESNLDGYAITELQIHSGRNLVTLNFSSLLPTCR